MTHLALAFSEDPKIASKKPSRSRIVVSLGRTFRGLRRGALRTAPSLKALESMNEREKRYTAISDSTSAINRTETYATGLGERIAAAVAKTTLRILSQGEAVTVR